MSKPIPSEINGVAVNSVLRLLENLAFWNAQSTTEKYSTCATFRCEVMRQRSDVIAGLENCATAMHPNALTVLTQY